MGILNVTPDSFSDGGRYVTVEAALARADELLAEGADLLDIGPESTRPGAMPVPPDEQIRRSAPVIRAIREHHPQCLLSIDTTSAAVAAEALTAGADVINDISALRFDPAMAALAAHEQVPVVLMHMQGTPETMQREPRYADVITEVRQFLAERMAFAHAAGIPSARQIIDPGIGFGKTTEHNWALLRGLDRLAQLGVPVLVGASRKGLIRRCVGADPESVLAGSLACALAAALCGARILRVHDVAPTVQWLRAAAAAIPPPPPPSEPAASDGAAGASAQP
jgi:dihydropteroate synthase